MIDIGLLIFLGCLDLALSGDIGFMINVVEHQSTSGTKVHNTDACAIAVLLNYPASESTVRIVIIRNANTCYCQVLSPGI